MPRYLVVIHRARGYEPAVMEDDQMREEIDALNREMVAAGVRVLVGGLQPVKTARAVRVTDGGAVEVTPGPYLQAGEHVGGLWVLEVAGLDEAVAWGRKAAVACRAGVEVRPFH